MTAAPGSLNEFARQLRVTPRRRFDLSAIDPASRPGFSGDREAADQELDELRDELFEFQDRLWAERKRSMLIVLQAMDGGGKDGTIRKVFGAFNIQGARVISFGVPTQEELAHDFMWRVHPHAPGRGRVAIFNRSHYEDVLVARVARLVPKATWSGRYAIINDWERSLSAAGTTILKFMLHISRDEQRDRLQKRLEDPAKHWKWSPGDLDVRARWGDYMTAYQEALSRTSTADAPWFVVPANHKWYRDLAVARIVVATTRKLDPKYPKLPAEFRGTEVPA